jgi:predicted RNA binding protein YcfA (HicA-like mRNA interferase family)
MNPRKLLERVLRNPANVRFAEFAGLVKAFGFEPTRVSGSHHIFTHPDIPELINIQE